MIQTFLVNTDLKMRKGKIAAQTAHGEVLYMEEKFNGHQYGEMHDRYIEWMKDGMMKKVVLRATEEEIHKFIDLHGSIYWMNLVIDKGLTQIPEDSMTCLVVEPLGEKKHKELFSEFKLL